MSNPYGGNAISKFSDSSYVRIYNNSQKEQLLGELNKNSFAKHYFFVDGGYYLDEVYPFPYIDLGHQDEYYIEVSDDLVNQQNIYYVLYRGNAYSRSYSGVFIDNEEILNKIDIFKNSVDNFGGFTNCKIYEKGKTSECEGTTYYAKMNKLDSLYVNDVAMNLTPNNFTCGGDRSSYNDVFDFTNSGLINLDIGYYDNNLNDFVYVGVEVSVETDAETGDSAVFFGDFRYNTNNVPTVKINGIEYDVEQDSDFIREMLSRYYESFDISLYYCLTS